MSRRRPKGKLCNRGAAPLPLSFPYDVNSGVNDICKPPPQRDSVFRISQRISHHGSLLEDGDDPRFHLGRTIIPLHYTLCLKPNLENMFLEGCVAIRCDLLQPTAIITLNAYALNISKVIWANDVTKSRREPFQFTISKVEKRLSITFDPPLDPNMGNLIINFSGTLNMNLNDNATGFYATKYADSSGEHPERTIGIGKLLPAEARKFFPCFDEPKFKATFGLSFVLSKTMTVVSNMPMKTTITHRTDKNLHTVEFETTPKMSPYLLAFAIGNLTFIEQRINYNLTCRIYVQNEELPPAPVGSFVFDTCKRLLSFFSGFFDSPFPLKKFDMIAEKNTERIATDNWGLSIFKRGKILVSDESIEENLAVRIEMMRILAHVLCKQWLGNLVTPTWWSHFWLYEGLGTFMEYASIAIMEPSFEMWMCFLTDIHVKALELDALSTSHMMELHINQPSEHKDTFDSLSSSKGAAILRMLEAYVGHEIFREGLIDFLKRYAYGNATTSEFWNTMEEISGKPIASIMTSWSKQVGFPLVRIVSSRYEHNCRHIKIHQEHFRADSSVITDIPNGLWMIPISIAIGADPNTVAKEIVMDKRSVTFKLNQITQADWFKLNPGTTGYYRVKYPTEMQALFRTSIRQKQMPLLDRFGLLSDIYAIAHSGFGSCTEIFSMLEAFEDEDDLSIWMLIDTIIHGIDLLLHLTDFYNKFLAFVKSIYRNIHAKLGWDGSETESYTDMKLRRLVITRLLICRDESCEDIGLQRFHNFISGRIFLPEQLPIIFKAGMKVGNSELYFRTMIRRFIYSDSAEERECILESLGFCTNEGAIREILEFSISDHVSPQDTVLLIKSFASNVTGRAITWDFFKGRSTIFARRYHPGSGLLMLLLQALTECFSTEEMSVDISDFFRSNQRYFPGCDGVISQSLEKIHMSVSWLKREKASFAEYLSKFGILDL